MAIRPPRSTRRRQRAGVTVGWTCLPWSVSSAGHVLLEQLDLRVVEREVAAGDDHVLNLRSNLQRVAANDDEVGDFSGLDAADLTVDAEHARGIQRQRLEGALAREAPGHRTSGLEWHVA